MLTVGKEFVYSDDYATQIRRYDVQTKKDILLYQYDNCVEISDIQSDGDAVIWEDYLGEDGTWRVVKQSKNKNDIQLLFSAKDTQSTMDAVTLKEKDGSVYWYDRSENNGKYGLYQYADKNISILNDDISLASPFQHAKLHTDHLSAHQKRCVFLYRCLFRLLVFVSSHLHQYIFLRLCYHLM